MPNEESKALPSFMYGDPANVVERMELDELGCSLCTKGNVTFIRVVCGEPRNEKQKGVPYIGHRCRWFDEKGAGNGS